MIRGFFSRTTLALLFAAFSAAGTAGCHRLKSAKPAPEQPKTMLHVTNSEFLDAVVYVVERGQVDVRVDGRPAEPLQAGMFFGEIALLRDTPRTATVTARTDTDVLALDRDEFISAVTGHPESAEAAQADISSRLGSLPSLGSI